MLRILAFSILTVCLASFSFADEPLNDIEDTPDDILLSTTLWLSDLRWEFDSPSSSFNWSSEAEGVDVVTSCGYRFRRSTEDAHAVILWLCEDFEGFEEAAILWIFSDWGEILWGVYDNHFVHAIQAANYHFASSTSDGLAGKLVVWDGDFETIDSGGSSDASSWGRIKSSLSR